MRFLISALLTTLPVFGCSCLNTASPCTAMGEGTVVFVARVVVDSGDGWGKGPARVVVEEPIWNVSKDLREAEINTAAGTSCYYHLEAGERYVIIAAKPQSRDGLIAIGSCSNTFRLRGNEHILEALRTQAKGGPPLLVGTVRRSTGAYSQEGAVAGALVTARSATARYQAVANASGVYTIPAMVADRYQIEVSRAGFVPNQEYNQRWSGRMVLNEATRVFEPDQSEPRGSITMSGKYCAVWDLSMWPRGRISGAAMNRAGKPLEGITVQAFAFDTKGSRESRPLRTAKTDSLGRYTIEPLPAGNYVVAVNGEKYEDREPYPPTFYSRERDAANPAEIRIEDSAEVSGINLVVPDRRTAATLLVEVRSPDGMPRKGATVSLLNPDGVQRYHSTSQTPGDGSMEVPVYLEEQYIVEAYASERPFEYWGGKAQVQITRDGLRLVIHLVQKLVEKQ